MEGEALQPGVEEAQKALETALDEACRVDVSRVDTGELIRIEETLAAATQAAKEAVSLRLRRRSRRAAARSGAAPAGGGGAMASDRRVTHRVFDDIRGKRWHAFAVHSSESTIERAGLPEEFRNGWLVFESSDELRRVAPIPDRWEELSIDDLRQLCHRATAAPRRTGPIDSTRETDTPDG